VIRVICSKCGMPANLPDSAAGKMAVCKCGQKNPIPRPTDASTAVPPTAPAPQAPQAAPVMVNVAAPAGGDDLALQDLDQDTGAKEAPPQPCPACQKPLPAGEIVCRHCGYVAQEGGMQPKDKRVINKPRPKSWGGKLASELTALDFIKMATSAQVFSSMVLLVMRTIFAYLLFIFVGLGCFWLLGIVAIFLSPIAAMVLQLGFLLCLVAMFYGTIMKEPFAVCQAACFGYDSPKTNDWPTMKTGFQVILTVLLPGIAGFLANFSGGPVVAGAVFWLVALFVVPMTFLSVAQSGGEWTGFNPVRIFAWMGKLILPYLGVAALIFVEIAVICLAGAMAIATIGLNFRDAQQQVIWSQWGMLAGAFLVISILLLHPFVYGAAMLGMLYRKYERKLVG